MNCRIIYRGFAIKLVRHVEPYHIEGKFVHFGFNVCSTDGLVNVMPGAAWFRTIGHAKWGVDCLVDAGGSPMPPYDGTTGVAERFWALTQARRHQCSPLSERRIGFVKQ